MGEESNRGFWSLPDSAVVNLFEDLDKTKLSDVLDIGCGIGRHTVYATKAGYNVTVMDILSAESELTNIPPVCYEKGSYGYHRTKGLADRVAC